MGYSQFFVVWNEKVDSDVHKNEVYFLYESIGEKGWVYMKKQYLSIDVGGTFMKIALVDRSGSVVERDKLSTPMEKDLFLQAVDQIVETYKDRVRAVCMSVPGKVDTKTGTVYFGGSLPFLHEVSLKEHVESTFHIPTSVMNDGKAAAMAELWNGQLKDVENGIVMILGTGVGGGIIANGQLLQGSHFQAGELSYMISESSSQAVLEFERLYGSTGSAVGMVERIGTALGLANPKDGLAVFEYINQKEEVAYRLFQTYCLTIAKLIYNVQTVVDAQRVLIGGGISAQPIVLEEIRRQYEELRVSHPFVELSITPPEFENCRFGTDANNLGAVYQYLVSVEENQK